MDSRHTSENKDRYTEAGEQAAQVLGEFMSMANEFSKKLDRGFSANAEANVDVSASNYSADGSKNDHQYDSPINEDWQKAGDYLRELREAAGYTIDGFAKALNRQDAEKTVQAAEGGREVFPKDWFDQAVEILKHRDPLEFFDKLKECYEPNATKTQATNTSAQAENLDHGKTARQDKMQAIFSDRQALDNLTESQFEELMEFMQSNYKAALQLVKKKS